MSFHVYQNSLDSIVYFFISIFQIFNNHFLFTFFHHLDLLVTEDGCGVSEKGPERAVAREGEGWGQR
jgi:hypothetical protein